MKISTFATPTLPVRQKKEIIGDMTSLMIAGDIPYEKYATRQKKKKDERRK